MNFNDFIYHQNNVPKDFGTRKLFFEELKNKFLEEAKQSPKLKQYYSNYKKNSVSAFLLQYAERKAYLIENYEIFVNHFDKIKEITFREKSEEMFDLIRQKKLFNLQLEWRAEKVKIPEIKASCDFDFWQDHIKSCHFVPLITLDDVEAMKQFLNDENYCMQSDPEYYPWQSTDELLEKNENGEFEYYPDWYQFYDERMGTTSLLLLPDIRGEKEEHYIDISRQFRNKKREEENKINPPVPYIPPPPSLMAGSEELLEFAEQFEKDEHFIELFRIWDGQIQEIKKVDDRIEERQRLILDRLMISKHPVYMPSGYRWDEAIEQCHQQYFNQAICDDLDILFEEYVMQVGNGTLPQEDSETLIQLYNEHYGISLWHPMILQGRELSDEPQDFNF